MPNELNFTPLQPNHFSLLHRWMNEEHVWPWWGENRTWNLDDIIQKYSTYCEGYKDVGSIRKPIHAYVIEFSAKPIGFIQFYNAYDFPRGKGYILENLPKSLAALDFYIGDSNFIGKGLGALILIEFLNTHVKPSYKACFVDPDIRNKHAIRTYEKAGFYEIKRNPEKGYIEMVKTVK